MKILVTGANGFIGKNLICELKNQGYNDVLPYDKDTEPSYLDTFCKEANFIYHLAGINRPLDETEYMEGNFGFTSVLLNTLKKYNNNCPIVVSSSIQAGLTNPYGRSKKAEEDIIFQYEKETGAKVDVYRLPNVFGKWCKPNYNSVIATFCHNITHNLQVQVNDPLYVIKLIYIDDLTAEFIRALKGLETKEGLYCRVPINHTVTLGQIRDLLYSFREGRKTLNIPDLSDDFEKKLYSTYLSYLPKDQFCYSLKMNIDERGSFTEIIKTVEFGQFSVNVTKPGITKGNHWHHTKTEKFLVVSGKGLLQFRRVDEVEIIDYYVDGNQLVVIDIPPGYTHCLTNIGETELITFMWVNEIFYPDKPDTYFMNVNHE